MRQAEARLKASIISRSCIRWKSTGCEHELRYEDVCAADVFEDLETRFPVAEAAVFGFAELHAEIAADGLG